MPVIFSYHDISELVMPTAKNNSFHLTLVILAFLTWGVTPLYFKWLEQVPAVELVVHRVIWSSVLLWGLLFVFGLKSSFFELWRSKKSRNRLLLTSMLITGNWLVFVYAVISDQTVEASLGYYINPLVSIALGGLFLGERLTKTQWLAVSMAVSGVIAEMWTLGSLSWIACSLAISFALYGLARKKLSIHPMVALAAETTWMVPVALAVMVFGELYWDFVFWGNGAFGNAANESNSYALPLILAGLVTVVPLLLYVSGLPGVTLTVAGFAQYIAPSMVFVLAVLVFNEPVPEQRYWTFGLIWCALLIVSIEGLVTLKKRSRGKISGT